MMLPSPAKAPIIGWVGDGRVTTGAGVTPAARVQAAIDCLDRILEGEPAARVLIRWARSSRFAGAGDRRAVRDHVHDALRRRRSAAWIGGGQSGRTLMIGVLMLDGVDPATLFTGLGHAPAPLAPGEGRGDLGSAPAAVRADLPDWLWPVLTAERGVCGALRSSLAQRCRAPVWLRVNSARTTRRDAAALLAHDGIETRRHPLVPTALKVVSNPRRVAQARGFLDGLVEIQDASSQAAVLALPLRPGLRILDFCAGGGGKALAVAAQTGTRVHVHDANPERMRDIAPRAARAGADIRILSDPAAYAPFDLVLVDTPCSGSGTWRRMPDAKWRLTPARLDELVRLQTEIAASAAALVDTGGWLAWMTCSLLERENQAHVRAILAVGGWQLINSRSWSPGPHGDGFYLAIMKKA